MNHAASSSPCVAAKTVLPRRCKRFTYSLFATEPIGREGRSPGPLTPRPSTLVSLLALIVVCLIAGVAGAIVGPPLNAALRRGVFFGVPKRGRRRRRRTGYYFSDDDQSWGDRRWRKLLTIASVAAIASVVAISGAVALLNFKSRPNAAAGYRVR